MLVAQSNTHNVQLAAVRVMVKFLRANTLKSTDTQPSGIKALLANSVSEILSLRQKVEHLQAGIDEPIAIVGMGCRFPGGANTPEAFWQLLKEGVCAVRDMGDARWSSADYYHPDAEAAGSVLAVDDDEIELQVGDQARQPLPYSRTSGLAHHVSEEQKSHFRPINP